MTDAAFTPACPQAGYGSPRSSRRRLSRWHFSQHLNILSLYRNQTYPTVENSIIYILGNRKCEPLPFLMFLKRTPSPQSRRTQDFRGSTILGLQNYPRRRRHIKKVLAVELCPWQLGFPQWRRLSPFRPQDVSSMGVFVSTQSETSQTCSYSPESPKHAWNCAAGEKTRCLTAFIFYHVYIQSLLQFCERKSS